MKSGDLARIASTNTLCILINEITWEEYDKLHPGSSRLELTPKLWRNGCWWVLLEDGSVEWVYNTMLKLVQRL